jgi:hypothetical protein
MNDLRRPGPALDDVAREFPRWYFWTGVSGILYARLPLTSPPMVARAKDLSGLIAAIRAEIGRRSR